MVYHVPVDLWPYGILKCQTDEVNAVLPHILSRSSVDLSVEFKKLPCRFEGLEEKVVSLQIPALYGVQSSAELPLRHERLGSNLVNLHLSAPSFIP